MTDTLSPAQVEKIDQRPSTGDADYAVFAAFVGMIEALSDMLHARTV